MYMDILKLRLHFGNGIDDDSNPILHRGFGSLLGNGGNSIETCVF